jgi:hypothetical protein
MRLEPRYGGTGAELKSDFEIAVDAILLARGTVRQYAGRDAIMSARADARTVLSSRLLGWTVDQCARRLVDWAIIDAGKDKLKRPKPFYEMDDGEKNLWRRPVRFAYDALDGRKIEGALDAVYDAIDARNG